MKQALSYFVEFLQRSLEFIETFSKIKSIQRVFDHKKNLEQFKDLQTEFTQHVEDLNLYINLTSKRFNNNLNELSLTMSEQ